MAEAYLLVMVTVCDACGKGPLEPGGHEALEIEGGQGRRMLARCKVCGAEQEFAFDLSDLVEPEDAAGSPRINPSEQPSQAIDLAQWLMLFEAIVRAADEQSDPIEGRRLGYEAAQCLEEALKFYPLGAVEWPDESAFFYESTLSRYREHRHVFARTRLVEMRQRLPSLGQMQERLRGQAGKRAWWVFWRRQ